MATHRITVSLAESAADVLARSGNASSYITHALEARWQQWQQALAHLLSRGWKRDRMVRVLRTLNGVHQVQRGLYEVARAMTESESPALTETELAACITLADEWWMGNAEVRRVLLEPHRAPRFGRQQPGLRTRAPDTPADAVPA